MSAWSINGPALDDVRVDKALVDGDKSIPLLIYPHQGMGDHIICNGLYRYWGSRLATTVCVRDDGHTLRNVRWMLSDRPDISVAGFETDEKLNHYLISHPNCVLLKLGYQSPPFDRWHFDYEFYRQAEVPFKERWNFSVPAMRQLEPPKEAYVFVHDKPARVISTVDFTLPVVGPVDGRSIFEHANYLTYAKEIHCISSAFAAFADCFDLTGIKLFFYPMGIEVPKHKNRWTYVD